MIARAIHRRSGRRDKAFASGANILHSDSRFALDYTINPNLGVTVHAVPLKDANGNYLYLGPVATKVVVYVVQLRNF